MFNQSGVDALCSATYLEDYLDCLDSLPNEIQRFVSEIRKLDSDYFDGIKKIHQLKDSLAGFVRPTMTNGAESSNSPSPSVPQGREGRTATMKQLKRLLLRSQSIADCKLAALSSIGELIDVKTRELDHDSKNIELDASENGVSTRFSNHAGESSSSAHRPVRSIMRGFMRGEKDRFSNLSGSLQAAADDVQQSRSEKNSALNVGSAGAAIFAVIANEAELESISPSTSSSLTAAVDGLAGSSIRQANKRPRRQKQFPDYVRMELDASASSLAANASTNGCGGSMQSSDAIASPAPSSITPRNSREKLAANVGQSNKRKKKRQKPDSTSSAAGSSAGKIKFNLPVDPDEPTYCLCEQVSYGEMIGCDNGDCDIEWFHFNCVGLGSKPKGKWFCPNCRGDRPNVMKQASKTAA